MQQRFLISEAHPAEYPDAAPVIVQTGSDGHDVGVELLNEDGVILGQLYVEYSEGQILLYVRPFGEEQLSAIDDPQATVLIPDVTKSLARLTGLSGQGGIAERSVPGAAPRFPSTLIES